MASIEVLTSRFNSYDVMYSGDLREQSFADWPFREDCNCTPEKMAKAGFVHCPGDNEPDVVCCFFCLIELEGWEPDDDPWFEHIKRSPKCAFLHLKRDFPELTLAEMFHLESERVKIFVRKVCHKKMAHMRDAVDEALKGFRSQLDSI
ncbi:baculoviral IAP repeat-containing protein 5b [Hippocampus zosterae]|uniref:baculoviral IAP repeat-containing protein 5b n=1 Tax=Hippocampus zosterae TaxID=109293 RepID=UPI00223E4CB9|nr:baculoviral IAP repeat-containing protein 5b [Hippocampus zosterae]